MYSLMKMVDAIKNSKVPIATIVSGIAASAAAVLFSCGHPDHRYVGPNATIMIHDVSSNLHGSVSNADITNEAEENKRLNQQLYELLALNCGKDKDFFLKKVKRRSNVDVYMNAKKAIKWGLATRSYLPVFVTTVTVSYDLVTPDRVQHTHHGGRHTLSITAP